MDILSLIDEQETIIDKKLQWLIKTLTEEERKMRQKYSEQKLQSIFAEDYKDSFKDIFLYASAPENFPLALSYLNRLHNDIIQYFNGLRARGFAETVDDTSPAIECAFQKLKDNFTANGSVLPPELFDIFYFFAKEKYYEFVKSAKEIDEEMESESFV